MQPHWGGYQPVARAPRDAWERPVRVDQLPGTPYGLVVYGSPRSVSGPAVGALVVGVASLLVATLVTCFGLAGAPAGWGVPVAGAFAILAGFLGLGGVGLGVAGLRRTRRGRPAVPAGPPAVPGGPPAIPGGPPASPGGPASAINGRGLAVAGLVCGAVAVAIVIGSLALAALVTLA